MVNALNRLLWIDLKGIQKQCSGCVAKSRSNDEDICSVS